MSSTITISSQTKKNTLIIALIAATLFITIKLYRWLNTESTDNAYLEADITFVSPEASGTLAEIFVQDHQMVTKGQILAQIDHTNYLAKLTSSKALAAAAAQEEEGAKLNLTIAQSKLEEAQHALKFSTTNYNLTQKEFDRAQRLEKQNFNSPQTLDALKKALAKAEFEHSLAKLNVTTAQNNITLSQVTYQAKKNAAIAAEHGRQLAQRAFENTVLRSPIDGIIGNTQLRIGSFAREGMPLLAITPSQGMYIKANFKETQIRHLQTGQTVTVVFDSIKSHPITGTVRSIAPATGAKFSLIPPDNATGNFTKVVQRVPVIIDVTIPEELKQYTPVGTSSSVYIPFN